jgi:hypothetical protein
LNTLVVMRQRSAKSPPSDSATPIIGDRHMRRDRWETDATVP